MKKRPVVKKQKPSDDSDLEEYDGEELSPDEEDADWPKRTPDTMADIMALMRQAEAEQGQPPTD
jgi:hypothetical protein